MKKVLNSKRKLVDITLDEAIKVIELGEGLHENQEYQLRKKTNVQDIKFAQLFYVYDDKEYISANFSDTKNAVKIIHGNSYYRTHYKIIKYLESQGFDLLSADSN